MHSLPLFHRIAGQTVIVLGSGDGAEARRRLVERAGGLATADETAPARLAFIAMDEPEALAAQLKARGVLVNVMDRPELCDFTMPSLLERGDVVVAVGTGGTSAGLAKALRLRLEGLLPASLGLLARSLGEAREGLRRRWSNPAERRIALDGALAAGGVLDPLAEHGEGAVAAWLDGAAGGGGGLAELTLTSDDPDELTLRAARLLGSADLIAYEPGVAHAILNRGRADAARQELGEGVSLARSAGLTVILRRG